MIRGATRGLFQSARQTRRAAARRAVKQKSASPSTVRAGEGRRSVCDLARDESIITNQQKHAFGRTQYVEMMPRILSVGAVGLLNVGAVDVLNISLLDMAAEDDDGR